MRTRAVAKAGALTLLLVATAACAPEQPPVQQESELPRLVPGLLEQEPGLPGLG